MALIESLQIYEKNPYEMIIICLDKTTHNILNLFNYKNVKTIPLHEIEKNDTALQQAKSNRSLIEYYWTLTPTIILRLFERYPWIIVITYLDADLFFYASPDPIYKELENYSVIIHEHRFSPEHKHLERNGKYNKGIVCFRNDINGLGTLGWWRNKCNEWCYHRLEDGKFGDQLYLNQFPIRFSGVGILQNIGAGVAPWNHIQYEFFEDYNGKKWVNNTPLIFYHFHSLEIVLPEIVVPSVSFPPFTKNIIRICFEPYAQQLYKNYQKLKSINANFAFGLKELDLIYIYLAHQSLVSRMKYEQGAYSIIPISKEWFLFTHSSVCNKKISDLLNKAKNEYHRGNTINAFNLLLKVVEEDPKNAVALTNLGVIYWENGDKRQAICYLNKAHQYDPYNKKIIQLLKNIT